MKRRRHNVIEKAECYTVSVEKLECLLRRRQLYTVHSTVFKKEIIQNVCHKKVK